MESKLQQANFLLQSLQQISGSKYASLSREDVIPTRPQEPFSVQPNNTITGHPKFLPLEGVPDIQAPTPATNACPSTECVLDDKVSQKSSAEIAIVSSATFARRDHPCQSQLPVVNQSDGSVSIPQTQSTAFESPDTVLCLHIWFR